jgi:hypothetical protein
MVLLEAAIQAFIAILYSVILLLILDAGVGFLDKIASNKDLPLPARNILFRLDSLTKKAFGEGAP